MAKFKVGDKVRVREGLIVGKDYGGYTFTISMDEYKGNTCEIKDVYPMGAYDLGNCFNWTDEMLEEVKENKIEKTVLEIINDGYTGKKYIHECGTIVYVDCKNVLRFDYRESNRRSSRDVLESRIVLDMKLKEYRKEYTFQEAFESYEEGKEIEDCNEVKYKKIDGVDHYRFGWDPDFNAKANEDDYWFGFEEIRGKWYIND